jgi:hypothetical protein
MLLFSARSERGEKAPQNCKKHVLQKKREIGIFSHITSISHVQNFLSENFLLMNENIHK